MWRPLRYRIWDYVLRISTAAVLGFLILPIIIIIPLSFTSGADLAYPVPGYSLRWYEEFANRPEWRVSIRNSLFIATLSSLLATSLGTVGAFALHGASLRVRRVLTPILILPMAVPIVIVAVAMYFFFARLGLAGTFTGLILAHATLGLPFVIISVVATLQGLDDNLPRAAANLGAGPIRTFFLVVVPLILPGIVSGAVFAFAVSLEDLVVALFIGGPDQLTLPRQMFSGVRFNISPTILAAATILVVVSAFLVAGMQVLRSRAMTAKHGGAR